MANRVFVVHDGVRQTNLARCARGKCINVPNWQANEQTQKTIHWNFKIELCQDTYLTVRAQAFIRRVPFSNFLFFPLLAFCWTFSSVTIRTFTFLTTFNWLARNSIQSKNHPMLEMQQTKRKKRDAYQMIAETTYAKQCEIFFFHRAKSFRKKKHSSFALRPMCTRNSTLKAHNRWK